MSMLLELVFASLVNDDDSDDFVACGPLADCYVDHPGV